MEKSNDIKSLNSNIVKMSYCIRELKRNHYIIVKSIGRKEQNIELTRLGTLIAKTYKILKGEKYSSEYFSIH
jgi:predicted transcriptional regulator